jgi:queuine tRNA-ribosyltransferase
LVDHGQLNLNKQIYETDHRIIDEKCICPICQSGYTRSYLNTIVTKETTACHLLTIHNVAYQVRFLLRDFLFFYDLDEVNVSNSSSNY